MKWWTKFKISAALDSSKELPDALHRKITTDPELEYFARQTATMGQRLRTLAAEPADLHSDIMRAVRNASRAESSRPASKFYWAAASGTLAAVAVLCLLLTYFAQPKPIAKLSFGAPLLVLEASENAPETVPSAVMSPLSDEWKRVNHDVKHTGEILAASFPF